MKKQTYITPASRTYQIRTREHILQTSQTRSYQGGFEGGYGGIYSGYTEGQE